MIPGATPTITTGAGYESGLSVHIRAFPQSREAELEIGSYFSSLDGISVTIDDIKEFMSFAFPGQNATVFAEADPQLEEPENDFIEDLQKITPDQLLKLTEFKKMLPYSPNSEGGSGMPYHSFDVKLDNEKAPLLSFTPKGGRMFVPEDQDPWKWAIACHIYHVAYKNSVGNVEKFVETVGRLLNHYPEYPFLRPPEA